MCVSEAVFRNDPVPDAALRNREAWNMLKTNPQVQTQLTEANVTSVETLLDLIKSRDVYFNAQLRPEVIAGYEVINFICAAVADQIKKEGGDRFSQEVNRVIYCLRLQIRAIRPLLLRLATWSARPPHECALWI